MVRLKIYYIYNILDNYLFFDGMICAGRQFRMNLSFPMICSRDLRKTNSITARSFEI